MVRERTYPLGLTLVLALILVSIWLLAATRSQAGGSYSDSGQNLGGDSSFDAGMADLDGDDDLDVFVANSLGNRVYLNNGSGFFSNSAQSLGTATSQGIVLGDVDGDDDIDAFVANGAGDDNEVWLNNGAAQFSQLSQTMNQSADSTDVALGDLDGDDDLDAFVTVRGAANEVYLNNGSGVFSSTQAVGVSDPSLEVTLGDVNGDDDLDVYVANGAAGAIADTLWINNGSGVFTDSGQSLDTGWNEGATLGDLDGDGDLDLYLADWTASDAVWINQGGDQAGTEGVFQNSSQTLSGSGSLDVALADVDDDGDLDAIVAKWVPDDDEIWLNDGAGNFTQSGQALDTSATYEVTVGDVDGDNDPDIFFSNFGANHVWMRGGVGIPLAWFNVDAESNPLGQTIRPWAQPGNAILLVQLSFPPVAAVEVDVLLDSESGQSMDSLTFMQGESEKNLTVTNPQPEVSEMVTITLESQAGRWWGSRALVNPLNLVFVDASEGDSDCSLCFADWLLKLLGFEPSFWMLHGLDLTALQAAPSWQVYSAMFGWHSQELSSILATHPLVLWDTMSALETWTPAIVSYDEGDGDMVTVSQEMVDEAEAAFAGIRDAADPELAAIIENELDWLDTDSLVGQDMDEVAARVEARVVSQRFLPVVGDE